jgi:type IV pilus assembly protein PilN
VIHINLLPVHVTQQASSRKKELVLAGGMLATTLVAVLITHIFQSSQLRETKETADRLQDQVTVLTKQNQDLEKMKRQKKELEEKIHVVNLLTSPQRRTASVRILDDLSASTPEFLWLTEYLENKAAVQIRGKAVDNQTIASFARNLSNSQLFRSVEIRETQQEPQVVAGRNRLGKLEAKTASTSSIMMTKFLIEAAVNYGQPIETASTQQEEQNSTPGKKEKKPTTKAASTANAVKTSKE